ncbi:MAG: GntR family transcriptional regulator [Lentisphaerae bacterium]|nr:GntR family transcriptional regulator [Lentisphaerota bacterium]
MAKYQEVYLQLASRIVNGELQPGQKLPSVASLAEQHNISYMTAHKVCELLCRNRLAESKARQGFFVRTILKDNVKFTSKLQVGKVGLLLSLDDPIYSNFYNRLVLRLFDAGHAPVALGCSWMMENLSHEEAGELLKSYAGAGVEILIIRGDGSFPYKALYEVRKLFRKIIFVMFYSGEMVFEDADKVLFDMRKAGFLAANHLWENNFDKFAFLTQAPASEEMRRKHGVSGKLFDLDMLDGVEEACKSHNIDFYRHGVIIAGNLPCAEPENSIKKRIRTAIEKGCNGFICMNDTRAHEVYLAAAEMGIAINKDIGVVGNFNTSIGESLNPRFSSVDLNVDMLIEGVISSLSGNTCTAPMYIQPKLIKRH